MSDKPKRPVLCDDMLEGIFDNLVDRHANDNDPMLLYAFALTGKQPLRILYEIFESSTQCTIDVNEFFFDMNKQEDMYGFKLLYPYYIKSMMKSIGRNITSLTLLTNNCKAMAIAEGACYSGNLVELNVEMLESAPLVPKILQSCSKSLKIVNICSNYTLPDFTIAPKLSLDELTLECDVGNDFQTFFQSECARTKTLIIEFYQYTGKFYWDWDISSQIFADNYNRNLNYVKNLKMTLKCEDNMRDVRLKEMLDHISDAFPSLKELELTQDRLTKVPRTLDKYQYFKNFRQQIIDARNSYKATIKWKLFCDWDVGYFKYFKETAEEELDLTSGIQINSYMFRVEDTISPIKKLVFEFHNIYVNYIHPIGVHMLDDPGLRELLKNNWYPEDEEPTEFEAILGV